MKRLEKKKVHFLIKKTRNYKGIKQTSYIKEQPNKNLTESTSTKISVSYNDNSNSTFLHNDDIEEKIKNIILNIPKGEKFKTPNITKNSGDDKIRGVSLKI